MTGSRQTIKTLSVKQPWAWAIAEGLKTIETRTWIPNHRGDILIVASLKPDKLLLDWLVEQRGKDILSEILYGKALAIVELVECRPMTKADEDAAMCPVYKGAFAWVLANVRKIEKPYPVKGRLGLYETRKPVDFEDLTK
ncbi:hypothetical protein LCGC14_1897480 [marine sediment metagenome]|uniref:ASCH domain-containing protein n=1 Tax=marine sediment metagenome TaxID=412755 RepID=A0A0F9IVN5_9ZZZZ